MSVPLTDQNKQVSHWFYYLKSQFKSIKEIPILIVGNKIDLVKSAVELQESIDYFDSLKKQFSLQYILVAAKKLDKVREFLDILKEKCFSFFDEKEYFTVPHLYKKVGEFIKGIQNKKLIRN